MKAKNIGWAAVLYIAGVAALYRSRIHSASHRNILRPSVSVPGFEYSAGRPGGSYSRSVSASPATPDILQSGY